MKNFFEKVAVGDEDSCWTWTGSLTPKGYARINRAVNGKRIRYAHQFAYMLAYGPIPAGLEIDHTCRNRACMNPKHLEAVTHTENIRRSSRVADGKCKRGHLFDIVKPETGYRFCSQCRKIRDARRDRRKPTPAVRGRTRALAMRVLSDGPKTLEQLGRATGKSYEGIKSVMSRLAGIGLVERIGTGVYAASAEWLKRHAVQIPPSHTAGTEP